MTEYHWRDTLITHADADTAGHDRSLENIADSEHFESVLECGEDSLDRLIGQRFRERHRDLGKLKDRR